MSRTGRLATITAGLLRKPAPWWLAVLVWASVLWLLSANKPLPSGPSFPFKDKVLHCTYFAGGAFCFLMAMLGKRRPPPSVARLIVFGLLFTGVMGALDEFHQTYTPGRSGNDPWDWLADLCGGLLAAWLSRRLLTSFPSAQS